MTRYGHGRRGGFYSKRRHYAYAQVNDAEYAVMKAAAARDGLSISDFVRRCVNGYLLELGDDVPLLEEKEHSGPRSRRDSTWNLPPPGGVSESHGGE